MPDVVFRIRSEGDIKQFLGSIQSSADSYISRTNRQLEQLFTGRMGNIFTGGFGNQGSGFGRYVDGFKAVGPAVRSASLEIDSFNNRLKAVAETGVRLSNGEFIPTGKIETFTGNAKGYIDSLEKIAQAETNLANTRAFNKRQQTRLSDTLTSTTASERARISQPFNTQIAEYSANRDMYSAEHQRLKAMVDAYKKFGAQVPSVINSEYQRVTRAMNAQGASIANAGRRMQAALAAGLNPTNNPQIAGALSKLTAFGQTAAESERAAVSSLQAARVASAQQMNAVPPVPANIKATLDSSTQLKNMLLKAGLGGGLGTDTPGFAKAVQGANFSAPYLDLVKGVTRVSGEFETATGKAVRFGAEIDKNGKVLTRFGGQLSGVGNFLRMIQRDFVKVIEWTVATTVVFASMGAAINTIKQINEVDKLLQRFAITAQMTAEETRGYFSELAKIAYQTATPLNEMIKVADDMALATRKAGQTTQEWTRQISEMGNAVGILTNIAGMETSQAADTLTATMKQLGVSTSDLVPILNKVSAVAGGQQQAISDVIRGLAVMAEAGKQAGLTIDQQIATVQTLSQVTSKSSAEVATAFKNLVGSIDSPGSIKILSEFGIQVRDAEGNARNFLQIYKDIQDAMDQGIIPEGRMKEVIRGISGGPRRAPDAAALLSNVNTIFEVEAQSVNAANEALLANAKILDTNSAKITQLQVKLDELAFEKFATVIRESVGDLAGIFKSILDIIGAIPNEWLKWGVQVLAFIGIIKAVSLVAKGIQAIIASFAGLIGASVVQAKALAGALNGTAAAARATQAGLGGGGTGPFGYGPPAPNPAAGAAAGGLFARLKDFAKAPGLGASVGTLGVGALLGAGVSAASGGDIFETIGSGLSGAGMTALVAPLPIPHIKALGAAALALGTALQFVGNTTKENKNELNSNTEAVLNAATAYTEADATIKSLTETQAKLIDQTNFLRNDKTEEGMNARIDAQNKLAEVTANLFSANEQLLKSYQDLDSAIAQSNDGALKDIKSAWIDAARNGLASAEQIKKIQNELELLYLKQAYPDQYIAKPGNAIIRPPMSTEGGTIGSALSNRVPADGRYAPGLAGQSVYKEIDAAKLNVDEFKKYFKETETGLKFTADMPKNLQTSLALYGLVAEIGKTNAEEADKFAKALEEAGIYMDNLSAGLLGYQQLQATLNSQLTLGMITPEQKANAEKQYRAALSASSQLGTINYAPGRYGYEQRQKDASTLNKIAQDPKMVFSPNTKPYNDLLSVVSKLRPELKDMPWDEAAQALQKMGFHIAYTADAASSAYNELDKYAESIESIEAAAAGSTQTIADMSLALYESYINGELTSKEYENLDSRLKNIGDSAQTAYEALANHPNFVEEVASGNEQWDAMIKHLEKIPGLENASSLSLEELIGKVRDYGARQDNTNQQASTWAALLIWIGQIINALPDYKVTTYEVRTVYTQGNKPAFRIVGGKKVPINAGRGAAYGGPTTTTSGGSSTFKPPPFPDFNLGIGGAGGGSSGGGGGSSARRGSVDMPEEFAGDPKYWAKKAVAWARKYQNAIPGERAEHARDLVAIMNGNNRILLQRGISEEYLRKAMQELSDQIKKQNELLLKADTMRRIRVGSGDFAAIANVPMNSKSGISVGGPGQPININLNINGQVMTPAQFTQLANAVAAQIKKSYQNS
jgi:TP901 family phage tail tape measure protein